MGSYMPEECFCPEDRVWQGEERSFFFSQNSCSDEFPGKQAFKMGGIKFFESSVSLAIQNFHQLSPHQSLTLMDVSEGFTTKLYGRRTELT